jgi:hypothetical protein
MSSLPIAQYCAQGPVLGQLGASRAAAISTCFHARCAGDERWRELYARLDAKEQGELDAMIAPTPLRLPWLEFPLDYAHALKEQPLGLDADLCFVPHSDPSAITSGTADAYWVVTTHWLTVVVVMDVKRSKWTSSVSSLQLHGYGTAICSLLATRGVSADAYQTAIWAATEGEWDVGALSMLDSDECESTRARIVSAARHEGTDYSRGRHCRDCYGRSMCPAYLMDPASAPDALAKYFSGELDNDHALQLLELTERAEETAGKARDLLKAYVTKHGSIVDGESVYRPVKTRGRVSLDAKRLEQDHPELVRGYMRTGADYDQVRWCGKSRGK